MKLIISIGLSLFFFSSCQNKATEYTKLRGQTMGTYYSVTCAPCEEAYQADIDSLLKALNLELSTYIPTSSISQFNRSSAGIPDHSEGKLLKGFIANLQKSKEIFVQTAGAFDPSIMPLVNYWGFGYTDKKRVEKADIDKIDSIMPYIGMGSVSWDRNNQFIRKDTMGVQLDFSSIAKGYGADQIAALLDDKGVSNYLIDIGGDGRSKGLSPSDQKWTLGISYPDVDASIVDTYAYISITDKAMATSGNYRNYHKLDDGTMYSHTIDPKTGFPKESDVLSASVIADDSMTADAWATAFMSMGLQKSISKSKSLVDVEVLLIYTDQGGALTSYMSEGFKEHILEID